MCEVSHTSGGRPRYYFLWAKKALPGFVLHGTPKPLTLDLDNPPADRAVGGRRAGDVEAAEHGEPHDPPPPDGQ